MELVTNWQHVVLANFANFKGRARRREFWLFTLANIIVWVVLNVLSNAFGLFGLVLFLYYLAVLVPSIAVGIRRLHDIGKSGWWVLISLIPIVGTILLIVWSATDSHRGTNQWGESVKYPATATA